MPECSPEDLANAEAFVRDATNDLASRESKNMSMTPANAIRETARLWSGARADSARTLKIWGEDAYDLYESAGMKVAIGKDEQSDEVIGTLSGMFGDEAARGPVGGNAAVRSTYDLLDDGTARMIAADAEFEAKALDGYFPHQFKQSEKPRGGGKGGFQLSPGFLKRRRLEGTLGEIMERRPDLDLATWDPVEYAIRHVESVDQYIASLDAVRGLKSKGLIRLEADAPVGAKWRKPDIAPFDMNRRLDGWVADPKVAGGLEDMFGVSAFDKHWAGRAAKGIREAGFLIKVFGGAFQLIDYSFRSVGLGLSEIARGVVTLDPKTGTNVARAWFSPFKATARAAVPGLDRRFARMAQANPLLRDGVRGGLGIDVDPSLSDEAIRGLGKFVPQTAGGRQIPGAENLQQVVEFMSGGAYAKFHREMLEQSYLVIVQKHLKAGVERSEAVRLAVEETNVFYSSIPNWQSAVRNRTTRDALKFPFFAIGEIEGWARIPFQAPAGFAGIMGSTVIAAEMMNKLFTGDWLSADQLNPYKLPPGDTSFKEKLPIIGEGGYNTSFLRPQLPSFFNGPNGRPTFLDILGQGDTSFRFPLDPWFGTKSRLGQALRIPLDIQAVLRGDAPDFGTVVENPLDALKFAAQEISPIPLAGLAGTETGRIGFAGAGLQVGGLNVSSAPTRDVIATRFEELVGRPFNSEIDYPLAAELNDPQINGLLEQSRKLGLAEGRESAVQRTEDEAFFLSLEQESGIPGLAANASGDNLDAPPAFRDALSELKGDIGVTIHRRFFGEERDEATTPEGQLYRSWQEIKPTAQQFPSLSGEVDMTAFFVAKEAAFEAFRKVAPLAAEAIENRLSVQDPAAQRLQQQLDADRKWIEEKTFDNNDGSLSLSYWDVADAVWNDFKEEVDYEVGATTQRELAKMAGLHGGEQAKKIKNFLSSRVSEIHQWMRDEDGELDARLRYWGYVTTLRRPKNARRPSDTPGGKAWVTLYPDMDMPGFAQP